MKILERSCNQRRLGDAFIDKGKRKNDQGADQGDKADQRMKQETHSQKDRSPRHVHQRRNHAAGKDLAQRVDVAQQLNVMRAARTQGSPKRRFKSLPRKEAVEADSGLHENAAAKMLECRVADEK